MVNQISDLDAVWEKLGTSGRYHIVNYILLLFPVYLAGMYASIYIFEAGDLSYRCSIPECDSTDSLHWLAFALPEVEGKFSKCKRYAFINDSQRICTENSFNKTVEEKCKDFIYSEEDTIVKDFDLGCQDWKRTLVGTVHNSGLFISLPLTGFISDRYGRKLALSIASLMNGIFGFIRSFSVNYTMQLVFEFLEAALGAGAYTTAFVIAMELVGPKERVCGNTLINAVYVFGLMTLAGLAWTLQSWRVLLRTIYVPAMLVFSYLWILNESVRWLLSKGRHDEAIDILKKAAAMNKVELSDDVVTPMFIQPEKDEIEQVKEKKEKSDSTLLRVLQSGVLRKRLFVCSFLWITCTFVYYGLSINAVSLAGNKYVNFMLVGFVEIPANIVCLLILDRFGRKKTLILTYVLSACLCIGLSFVSKGNKWISLIVYLSGKFSITVAYSSLYVYVSEVFPTNVRQFLLALCSSIGRVGSTLAPLTPLLSLYYERLPSIFFGCMALVAGMMVFTLPETINMRLPDTLEEAERLTRITKKEEPTEEK